MRDPDLLTILLGRRVLAVEEETAMGMQRVVALGLENGVHFPLPAGNALRSAGEIAEVRALLSGLSRQLATVIRRQVGPGDPTLAADIIDAKITAALADPDALQDEQDPASFPLARP
ncbi:MAG: hypothetical protein JJT88_19210 [Gammaproteobacteria bacterium]|nr:hypothetical protein [Gammaproteobacteria bacterium]